MFPFPVSSRAPENGAGAAGGGPLLERAPALKEAAETVVASLVKNLQTMAGPATTIDGMARAFTTSTPREIVASHRSDTVAALIECPALSCNIVATLDATLVHAMVELLCGGNGAEPPPVVARTVTSLDQQFAHILVTLLASAIQGDWADFGFGVVRAAKIDGGLPADVCGARVTSVGVVGIMIGAFNVTGTLRLVLPPAALGRFGRAEPEAAPQIDASAALWTSVLQREIGRAPVVVDAYLDARHLSLGAIADLRVGQILALDSDARSKVSLVCDDRVLYRGEIGQADDRYTVRIADIVVEAQANTDTRAAPAYADQRSDH